MTPAWKTAIETTKFKVLKFLAHPAPPRGRTKAHMMTAFGFMKRRTIGGLPESRVLDRALQALRKEGIITYEKGQWALTPAGWSSLPGKRS